MPWTPDAWDDQKYAKAKRLLAEGQLSPGKQKEIEQKVAVYESREGLGDTDSAMTEDQLAKPPAPLESPKVAARTAQLQADVPAAGQTGYWTPKRPLGAMDFVPQDAGGNLAMWRDMPLEVWKERVAAPARQAAIAKGLQAKLAMQRMGPMVPPDQMPLLVQALAEAHKAENTDLDRMEDSPGVPSAVARAYKEFNDQQWQKAVQERAGNPEAGPIQRLEQLGVTTDPETGKPVRNLPGKIAYGIEKGKDFAQAGLRGALDMASLGLGAGAMDALNEAVGGREAMQTQRDLQTAHPLASAAGAIGGAVAAPLSGGVSLARMLYAGAKPALGKWGAGALAGGATAIAEGLGKDASQEAADAISDAPEAEQDMGRLDPDRLAANTAIRGGAGALGGLAGEGVASAGEGLRRLLASRAQPTPNSPSAYQKLESLGWEFDPIRGVKEPQGVKDAMKAAELRGGTSWAEDFAGRARGPVIDSVNQADDSIKAGIAAENEAYYRSVGDTGKKQTMFGQLNAILNPDSAPKVGTIRGENMRRAALQVLKENEGLPLDQTATIKTWLTDLPEEITPRQFDTIMSNLSDAVNSAPGSKQQLGGALERIQAAAMKDRSMFPAGNQAGRVAENARGELVEGFDALKADADQAVHGIRTDRQLTGARLNQPASRYLPDDAAELTRNLRQQGSATFDAAKEAALDKYLPGELKQEALLLRGANLAQSVGGKGGEPSVSRTGLLNAARDIAKPRLYGLGRSLGSDLSGLGSVGQHQTIALPDNYPISPRFYSWISARMPRAIVPGMNLAAEISRVQEIRNKPTPNIGDLTPEQKAFLQEILQ